MPANSRCAMRRRSASSGVRLPRQSSTPLKDSRARLLYVSRTSGKHRPSCIIGKLKEGAAAGGPSLLGAAAGNGAAAYPPTPAVKRFADSLVRQKGIKPPPAYKTSISICRKFLSEHAPKKADGETAGKLEPKPVSPAQLMYAKKIAQGKSLVIPEEAKASTAAMSPWIDSNRDTKRRRRRGKTAYNTAGSAAPQLARPIKRSRKRKTGADAAPSTNAQPNS